MGACYKWEMGRTIRLGLAVVLLGACSRDGVSFLPVDAADPRDLSAETPLDLAPPPPRPDLSVAADLERAPCVGLSQPVGAVTGTAAGYPFTARIGVAGWQYGEGSCDGQSTVYLFEDALPSEDQIPIARGLRIVDESRFAADLGAVHPVLVVYVGPQSTLTAKGTVEWVRRDDFRQPGGVLEGILFVDGPTWSLKGRFVAQRCDALDVVCI